MSDLTKRVLVLLLVFATTMGGYSLVYFYQRDSKVWSEVWVPKVSKVKEYIVQNNTDSNRIIILAGSNGLFGYDSQMIRRLTRRTTLNLSTHAGLPFEYHIRLLSKVGRSGDLIVLPLEISYYYEDHRFDNWSTHNLLVWNQEFMDTLSTRESVDFFLSTDPERVLLGTFAKLLKSRVPPKYEFRREDADKFIEEAKAVWSSGTFSPKYQHTAVNRLGDMQSNEGRVFNQDIKYEFQSDISKIFLQNFENLRRLAKDEGMSLLFTWPILVRNREDDEGEPAYFTSLRQLKENLAENGIQIAGDLEKLPVEKDFLHDTIYHLNQKGRQEYSQRFAQLLIDELDSSDSSIIRP